MKTNSVIAAALGATVLGFVLGVVVTGRPEPRAAASLTGFLILILLALGAAGVGLAAMPGWLQRRKRQAELDDAKRVAQIYSALSGLGGQPRGDGPSIYIVGGGTQAEAGTVEDLARALGVGR